MKSSGKAIACIIAVCALILISHSASAQTILYDSFDTDHVGSFPGGWTLRYNGAGTQLQVVDTSENVSKPNSLKLVGSNCWSANAYHPVSFPAKTLGPIRVQSSVFVDQIVTGGCGGGVAGVIFENPSIGTWGTEYAGVTFGTDGYIYSGPDNGSVKLGAYKAKTWYLVAVDMDMTKNISDIYVNGVLLASNLPITASGAPTGIELYAGHPNGPANSTAWFDNVSVSDQTANAYWDFEEGAGVGFVDEISSGQRNNGILINGLGRVKDSHSPASQYSLLFDQASKIAVAPDSPSLRPTQITLEAWIKPANGARVVFGKQLGTGCCANSYQLELNPFRFQLTDSAGVAHFAGPGPNPSAGQWHHVAGTWDGKTMNLYLDKNIAATATFTGKIGYDFNPVLIGGDDDGNGVPGCCSFVGEVDSVRVSGGALNPSEFLP